MANNDGWNKKDATNEIRNIARSKKLTYSYTKHAKERMLERSLFNGDILYVLRNGFIHLDPIPSTRENYNKYAMECPCPNSRRRAVRVIVIPDKQTCFLKAVSVMWVDEKMTRAGTIIGVKENE